MSNNNLKRVAVITGSSRRIGKAIAKELTTNNYSILLNARGENELIEAVQEIRNEVNDPNQIAYLTGDISDEKICISLMEEAMKRFGRINVLINNAGISGPSERTNKITSVDWDYVIGVNLRGAFLCTREALKYMLNSHNNTTDSNIQYALNTINNSNKN